MTSQDRIIVQYAHPAPQRSPLHRALADSARALPGVLLRDLYELYPDFDIDGPGERALLEDAAVLVFLHPVRWYGMPALLKEWVDTVFNPDWAYARNRGALVGKNFLLVASTGSGADAYQADGLHGRPFADFLAPFEQTAALCGMRWLEPLILHGAGSADDAGRAAQVAQFRSRLDELLQSIQGVPHGK